MRNVPKTGQNGIRCQHDDALTGDEPAPERNDSLGDGELACVVGGTGIIKRTQFMLAGAKAYEAQRKAQNTHE